MSRVFDVNARTPGEPEESRANAARGSASHSSCDILAYPRSTTFNYITLLLAMLSAGLFIDLYSYDAFTINAQLSQYLSCAQEVASVSSAPCRTPLKVWGGIFSVAGTLSIFA